MSRKTGIISNRTIAYLLIAAVLVVGLFSIILAKYIYNNKQEAAIYASGFHFSSDYLESEPGAAFNVSDWTTEGIVFHLYNYEKENVSQISDSEIRYMITVPEGWKIDSVKDENGNGVAYINGSYVLPKADTKKYHTVTLKYTGTGIPSPATITVTSTSPYEKQIQAIFSASSGSSPEFSISQEGDAIKMIIKSNAYSGDIRVIWPDGKVSPNNANQDVDMSTWNNNNASTGESFSCKSYHTYTLFFLKNTTDTTIDKSEFVVTGGN